MNLISGSNFKDLEVWQLARQLAVAVYKVSKQFPKDERFGLTEQVRRASVSIASNIAEGHGRRTDGAFIQFVRISLGSLNEVETQLIIASDLAYLSATEIEALEKDIRRLAIKLQNLIAALKSNSVRESESENGIELEN